MPYGVNRQLANCPQCGHARIAHRAGRCTYCNCGGPYYDPVDAARPTDKQLAIVRRYRLVRPANEERLSREQAARLIGAYIARLCKTSIRPGGD